MLRLALVLCLVVMALATPPVSRSRKEIEEFRNFLESTKTSEGQAILSTAVPLDAELSAGKFQGDILLDDEDIQGMVESFAQGRNAYTVPNTKWPDNVVVWDFAPGEFGPVQIQAVLEGIRDIERHTCVRFRNRRPEDTNYVSVTGGAGGCFANVGYSATRGVHTLNLARNSPGVGCFRHPTVVHEWLHILGFLHMHSTHDRDDWVDIVEENIIPSTMNNFFIYGADQVDNLGIDYDYVSCMHYGAYAFSNNGQATIVAKQDHEGTMGQRIYITDDDWLRLNRHYNCPGAWD